MERRLVLEIKDLTVVFGKGADAVTAVDHFSFSLYAGEIAGIVGESGSGKSVTALAVMRLLQSPPAQITSGEITFYLEEGPPLNITSLSDKEMQKLRGRYITMIFQEPMTSLNPVYRCGEQVAEVIRLHKGLNKTDAKRKVLTLFEEVLLPLPERIYKAYPHQLSGGQKQRVMIAMAMANNPALIIADEPTTALDVTVQKTILELLKNIRDKYGMAVMFITHDLGVVSDIADKVVVMYKGKCVEQNTAAALFKNASHPYTQGLMACKPDMKKRLKVLPTVSDFMAQSDDGIAIPNIIVSAEERQQKHKKLYTLEPLISVRNLCKTYSENQGLFSKKKKETKVLNNVSFDVYPGETLGLVGESGCGKTTLGRTLLKLTPPTSGQAFYNNVDILALSAQAYKPLRKELQIIFQDPYSSLNPRLTIGDAIEEPLKAHKLLSTAGERRRRVFELLEKTGLSPSIYRRYPHEFSGGQRQRIVIARTLAMNPRFIICDESVSALDVSVQAQVLNLLNTLKEEFGLTYIFISHDLSVVKYLADRIMIMKNGEIVETNEADALYTRPENEYTRKLIEAIPGKQF